MPTFHIQVEEKAWCYRTVTYEVDAQNHDEAREMMENGYAGFYDGDSWDDLCGVDSQEIEDVECQECYSSYDCNCGQDAEVELDEFLAAV